jgi:hypothetical protein
MQTVFRRVNGLLIVGMLMLSGFAQATSACVTGSLASVIPLEAVRSATQPLASAQPASQFGFPG